MTVQELLNCLVGVDPTLEIGKNNFGNYSSITNVKEDFVDENNRVVKDYEKGTRFVISLF